ncbi:hypothetical protein Tco_0294476 [Tanacetum coccineum]
MRHDSRRLLPYFLIILSKMPPVVSDVVVAAAVEDCSGYFSANVEFVHVGKVWNEFVVENGISMMGVGQLWLLVMEFRIRMAMKVAGNAVMLRSKKQLEFIGFILVVNWRYYLERHVAGVNISQRNVVDLGKVDGVNSSMAKVPSDNPPAISGATYLLVYRDLVATAWWQRFPSDMSLGKCPFEFDFSTLFASIVLSFSGFSPAALSLGKEKFTDLHDISNIGFLEHYFNFAAYNELAARANIKNAVLTDYIGRIQAISSLKTSGQATTNRIHQRTIDIQNLRHVEITDATPVLDIENQRYEDPEQEKMRNRIPFTVFLEVDPRNYQKVKQEDTIPKCKDHRPHATILYSDGLATTSITYFRDQANSLTRECNELLVEIAGKDPYRNTFVVGALINMYSKWGNIDEARLVFDSAVYKNNSMDFNDDSLRAESASSPAVPIGTSCWIMVVGYAICN